MKSHRHRWPEWEAFANGTYRQCACDAVEQLIEDIPIPRGSSIIEFDDADWDYWNGYLLSRAGGKKAGRARSRRA